MDMEEPVEQHESKKRGLNESSAEEGPKSKKAKVYSVKQFRKQLHSAEKLNALKEFLSLISNTSKHDYILDYLKNGGNCLELLQILESDSAIPPTLVFDLVTQLLFAINAKYGQYYSSAHESCRYLINNYLPVVHKMLGLSSSKEERKVCLKLLTAMAAFSSNLAKDILVNVKFHSANIELLTKHTGEKNSVRDCFIHFLTAFLIDSDLHTLSILLEKSGLLTGIISGLQYDDADTVCVVVTAMKNHILENTCVMKTTKMHVFNTAVVKDIVNLYNWKGPGGLKALEKNNKTLFEVDKLAKSKVSECIHDFLLVLCTSHKFGVIFKDHLVGLGRKNLNGLMYTVLESLDRPWEHSYASELVIKICRSCPDLTKTMWAIVKPFLEPRLTEKWLITMNFAKKLIDEMEPACIEYCAKDLSSHQLAQVIEVLVSPSPILKTLFIDDKMDENNNVKSHIMKLLYHMLKNVNSFLNMVKNWISVENFTKTREHLSNYIVRHYPSAPNLLEDWKNIYLEQDDKKCEEIEKQDYLETVLDILNLYKEIAPQLLYNLTSSSLDFKDLLLKLSTSSEEKRKVVETLQIKIISIFVDIDHSYFLPKTEIFSYIVPILLKIYHKERDMKVQKVLFKLLRNTGIFDSSMHEINIWLNGIFNFNTFTEHFANDFVKILKNTTEKLLEYQEEISLVTDEGDLNMDNEELIYTLLNISESNYEPLEKVKHRSFSPIVLGLLKYGLENAYSKNLKKYVEFVLLNLLYNQTNLQRFVCIIQKYQDVVPSNIFNYISNWSEAQPTVLSKMKGSLTIFKDIGEHFLNDSISTDLLKQNIYPNFLVDILRMSTFIFANLVASGIVSQSHSKNWICVIQCIIENYNGIVDDSCLELILGNPCLIRHFNIIQHGKNSSSDISTRAILAVVKDLRKSAVAIENYVQHYSHKIFECIGKILKNPKKYNVPKDIKDFLEVFPLSYSQCIKIITKTSHLLAGTLVTDDSLCILDILIYCLERIVSLCQNHPDLDPLDKDVLLKITSFLVALNKENKDGTALSRVLKQYFELFPHNISDIDQNLFVSILTASEYHKDNVDLAILLLERDLSLVKEIEANVASICDKKGLILPIVHVLVNNDVSNNVLEIIYEKLEASIIKALHKPQKVGQHFAKNYDIASLIEKCMPFEKCVSLAEKIQKFEVAEVFHARLLEACYNKAIVESDVNEKQLNNIIMTFVHLEMFVFKKKVETDDEITKIDDLSRLFSRVLDKIYTKVKGNLSQIANDTFKTFCKFALKFGVSKQHILLTNLRKLVKLLANNIGKDDANLLLDMLLSHSEFLNVVLGEHSETKVEVLRLFWVLCDQWNELMEKSHVAVVLSAYRGMVTRCDRTVLALLKLFESKPEQTRFYDFKPFLWGRAAATHYSVRSQIASSLTRQPKISDVLGILKEELVHSTINNYPLKESLHQDNELLSEDLRCYDLKFLLPLFSHILAPEQQVKTYEFIRSGGLSLTVVGLACHDKEVRQAACHVLSRLHFHLEARQTGKDNLLWIRYLEALCKGVAVLPNFKLNSFSAIFFARMALILTNPKHVMYTPLSSYLTAKQDLDLSTVPELYTLLFSPDVSFKEHRNFILEILRDGMKTEKDFLDFLKSMGYKLFSELFSSCLSDAECKLLILDIVSSICKVPLGVTILIENYSLLSQLSTIATNILSGKLQALPKLFSILLSIVRNRTDKYTSQIIFDICQNIFESDHFLHLKDQDLEYFYETIYIVYTNSPTIVRDKSVFVDKVTMKVNDRFCQYVRKYGCRFISEKCVDLQENNKFHFLRLLIYKLLT